MFVWHLCSPHKLRGLNECVVRNKICSHKNGAGVVVIPERTKTVGFTAMNKNECVVRNKICSHKNGAGVVVIPERTKTVGFTAMNKKLRYTKM